MFTIIATQCFRNAAKNYTPQYRVHHHHGTALETATPPVQQPVDMEGGYCFSWDMSVNFISQKEALKLLVAHSYWSHIWNTEPVFFQSAPGQTKTRYQREDRGAVYLIVKYCMTACLNAISNLIFRLLDTFSDHRVSIKHTSLQLPLLVL